MTSGPLEVAHWRYDFEDTESGCRVTESFRGSAQAVVRLYRPRMGDHSSEHAEQEMTQTLANLAKAVQSTSR